MSPVRLAGAAAAAAAAIIAVTVAPAAGYASTAPASGVADCDTHVVGAGNHLTWSSYNLAAGGAAAADGARIDASRAWSELTAPSCGGIEAVRADLDEARQAVVTGLGLIDQQQWPAAAASLEAGQAATQRAHYTLWRLIHG